MNVIPDQKPTRTIASNEAGMVSIIVTVILMFVISITVLGFAQIIRREQRQALDQQLSSQAFYAAESGINDARQYIAANYLGQIPPVKDACGPTSEYNLDGKIDDATSTSYSCLLINGTPKSLEYDLSTSQSSKVFPLNSDSAAISSLEINWNSPEDTDPLDGCYNFVSDELPPAGQWSCGYGIVRLDLVPVEGGFKRDDLMRNTFTSFLTPTTKSTSTPVPYSGGTNIFGGSANQGSRPAASCNANSCKVVITGLNSHKFYVRAMTIYRNTKLTVTARDASGNSLSLSGAQVMIDATGRANDVLRRVQVHLPLVHDGLHNDYGVETTDSLCKLFATAWGNQNNTACL